MKDNNESPLRFPRPKKKFGQHFLKDRNIIEKIVSVAEIKEGERVLEIGPGTGLLTEALIGAGALVTAIEVDEELIPLLKEKFSSSANFELVPIDVLKVPFIKLAEERDAKFKCVSNLPYNISGPVLAKFIEEREAFTTLVLMFQKEVAERIISGPGTKDYGVLSVLAQTYADVRGEFHVSRRSFSPPPKVDSTVISIRMLPRPKVDVVDQRFYKTVVRAAFGQRRKTLSNALKVLGLPREEILSALIEASIDPERRGETLSIEEFAALTRAFIMAKKGAK